MASWAIIEKNKKLLFIKRSNETTRPGQWCFPGGGIKKNETPERACIREAFEETSLNIKIKKLVYEVNNQYYYKCIPENNE